MMGTIWRRIKNILGHRQPPEVNEAQDRITLDRARAERAAERLDAISASVAALLRGGHR